MKRSYDCYCSATVTPKNTKLAAAAPGTPTAPSALPVTPLARSGSVSGSPHAMSRHTAVFVNARIVRMRLRPAIVRSSCSSHDRRAAWRASGRSRWRSAATVSRRQSTLRWSPTPRHGGAAGRRHADHAPARRRESQPQHPTGLPRRAGAPGRLAGARPAHRRPARRLDLDDQGRSRNTLSVEVGSSQVRFLVNGTEVTSQPRSAVDTDGITGLRITHLLDVHIGDL